MNILDRLAKSKFRSRFKLRAKEHGLTYNKAILKYLKDNNIKYNTEDEDKIESVKRVIRRLKKTNKRIKNTIRKNIIELFLKH